MAEPESKTTKVMSKDNPEGLSRNVREEYQETVGKKIRKVENKASEIRSKTRFQIQRVNAARVARKQRKEDKRKARLARKQAGTKIRIMERFAVAQARIGSRLRTTDYPEFFKGLGQPILRPKFLRDEFFEVGRTAQWVAGLLLPIVIIVSLAILTAIKETIEEFFLNGGDFGDQLTIFRFFVTAINLGLFCAAIWFWFLWVRTGGFRQLDFK